MQSNSVLEKAAGGRLTGFLFRSSIVRDYPGIEVQGYRSDSRNALGRSKAIEHSSILSTF